MTQELILIRGLPGSGKSTMAKTFAGYDHFEADMFFCQNGAYDFDPAHLKAAHAWCLQRAQSSLAAGRSVVVSNTFTRHWEMADYKAAAVLHGVPVRVIVADGHWPNVHGVPQEAIQRMRERWEA